MTSSTTILGQLIQQAYQGEPGRNGVAWHGPSLLKLLDGVTAEMAAQKPVGHFHSIWELVLHIAQWDDICCRRLTGENISTTTGDPEDWPTVEAVSEQAWSETLERLKGSQAALLEAVAALAPEQLLETVPGWGWSKYLMVHGTLHHDLYHAGQIALIRKVVELA
jgi:uncharacterized damage-inducible protein DinB